MCERVRDMRVRGDSFRSGRSGISATGILVMGIL